MHDIVLTKKLGASAATLSAALAIILAACSGDDGHAQGAGAGHAVDAGAGHAVEAGGEFTIYTCEPQNLTTGHSSEACGSMVLEQLFSGLTAVDYETSEAVGLVATDWDTEDNINWTFNLRDDFTFHNGEQVTAQTFVDTWNWVIDPQNAQQNANFMNKFVGYDDVIAGDADTMSGVEAIDDTTMQITLTEPFSPLPIMLSYTGFYPQPEVAFEDIDAFQEAPIGNGRYQMDGVWEHNDEIAMTRYEDWPGDDPGLADRIVWRIYDDVNTAYLDVKAGSLDILSGIPPERIASVDGDFGDNWFATETSSFTYLGVPLYQDEFDDVDIRRALSMAVDRQQIIDVIFSGSQTPAAGIIPHVLSQHRSDACDYCHFDPEEAAALYEAAGGPTALEVWFDSGVGHETWVEAVVNMWREHLGIELVEFRDYEFAQYLDFHDEKEVTGPFRLGWALSYPSPQYAMEPIYTTGQSSNYTTFSNTEFDNLITQANGELEQADADALYQQAEGILLEEMPVIPLWYGLRHTVHSDNVGNVAVDARTFVRVEQVQVQTDTS